MKSLQKINFAMEWEEKNNKSMNWISTKSLADYLCNE